MASSGSGIVCIPSIYQGHDQLYVLVDMITEEVERNLITLLNQQEWMSVGSGTNSRRVIHYGRRYNYHTRRDDGPTEPIPYFIQYIADHLVKYGVLPRVDQVIVNEYSPGQGISAHTDIKAYGDIIASLALGEDTNVIFRRGDEVIRAYHPRRSLVVFAGMYRNQFTHEIAGRKTVDLPDGRRRTKSNTRISLTLRYMAGDE